MVNPQLQIMYAPPNPEDAAAKILSLRPRPGISRENWKDIQTEAFLLYSERYHSWKRGEEDSPPTVSQALGFAIKNARKARGRRHNREESMDRPDSPGAIDPVTMDDQLRRRSAKELIVRAFQSRPAEHQHLLQTSPQGRAEVFLELEADDFPRGAYKLQDGCAKRAIPEQLQLWATEPNPQQAVTAKHAFEALCDAVRRLDR